MPPMKFMSSRSRQSSSTRKRATSVNKMRGMYHDQTTKASESNLIIDGNNYSSNYMQIMTPVDSRRNEAERLNMAYSTNL